MKYISRDGSAATLYGISGELFRGITHELTLSGAYSGTAFSAFEAVTWATGTGQMLAINSTTPASATKMWIQLLTGSAQVPELSSLQRPHVPSPHLVQLPKKQFPSPSLAPRQVRLLLVLTVWVSLPETSVHQINWPTLKAIYRYHQTTLPTR